MKMVGKKWLESPEKRSMDIAIASAASPAALAIIACAAAALCLETPGQSPLFWQERIGQSEQSPLMVPKLRTLRGDITHQHSYGHNHSSATTVGKFLRALHLDELTQLPLVINGTMSMVGPRPIVRDTLEQTMDSLSPTEQEDYLYARKVTKPGMMAPDSHLQHEADSGYGAVRTSALAAIEYAYAASFAEDVRIMTQVGNALAKQVAYRD